MAASKGAVELNLKLMDAVQENLNAALEFARQVPEVNSPSTFFELSAAHVQKQFENPSRKPSSSPAWLKELSLRLLSPGRALPNQWTNGDMTRQKMTLVCTEIEFCNIRDGGRSAHVDLDPAEIPVSQVIGLRFSTQKRNERGASP